MNIVHVVEPFASGIAVFVKSLVDNMKDDFHLIVHGERESVMKAAEVQKSFTGANVQFVRWKSAQREISLGKDFKALMELFNLLRDLKQQHNVDAVHLHSSKSGFIGRLACKMAGIDNVVYTPNGAPFLVSTKKIKNYFYRMFEKVGNLFGGKVVCCSLSEMIAYRRLGIDAININNGVTVKTSNTPAVDLKKDPAVFQVVTAARILNQKNPALFNEIAKQFEHIGQIQFIWIGDGEDRDMLTASNITVTGWLPPAVSKRYISNADVYLSTSNFEGLSFSVLEALALKKPVLLRNCVGNKDMVKNGMNGDLFDTAQGAVLKIMQYYNNPGMLPLMGDYSSEVCDREFNIKSTSVMYRNLYKGQYVGNFPISYQTS
ncbi:MAG: glycosyltransferase [Chitinophagaceae bacterium]|nr:MAG: glycosyltransferase [Chitinophagaceae bacterium]